DTVSWMCAIPLMLAMGLSQSLQRACKVGTGEWLVPLPEHAGRIDVAPGEELPEDFGAPRAKRFFRHPGVLAPHLVLVLVEPGGRRAEDRQVDIDQCLGIGAFRLDRVASAQDQVRNPLRATQRHAKAERRIARQGRAQRLVIRAVRVVDGVVEPQRELNLRRASRVRPDLGPARKALIEMLHRMVVTLRLAIAVEQARVQLLQPIRMRYTERCPRGEPAFVRAHAAQRSTSITCAWILPSTAPSPNRRAIAAAPALVASPRRATPRASISPRSGVPWQYAMDGSRGDFAQLRAVTVVMSGIAVNPPCDRSRSIVGIWW